jgi:hypothetical protein
VRLNIAIPEAHVKAPVLDGALEAVTRLNESMIKAGGPTSHDLLAKGAIWQPEPPGQEHFDHGGKIEERGWGDCDDWAPLHAATLRVTGVDPGAVARVRKTGPKRWHATVYRSDGTEDDPSVKAGMGGSRSNGIRGATLPLMLPSVHGVGGSFIATPHLALRPVADRHGQLEAWQARADLPWHWQPTGGPADTAMVSLHQSPVSSQAVCGAVRGAFRIGLASGQADPEHLKRMSAIADACEGYSWEEINEVYGPEHADAASQIVGSFFGKAFKKLGKIAKGAVKLAAPALNMIPGGSIATAAFNMASKPLKKSVVKQLHVAPAQRKPLILSQQHAPIQRAQQPIARPPAAAGMPQFLPYPYPLPYPVPGWSGAGEMATPGQAWPR